MTTKTPPDKPLIEYPTVYPFKVMGKQADDFVEHVRALFGRVLGVEVPHDAIAKVPSSKGTFVSVTVSVTLHSEEHRKSVYLELHKDERVVYYL